MTAFDSTIPILVNAGNHDIQESPRWFHVDGFQRTWGDTYFHFWVNGRVFIAIETQFFRSSQKETVKLMNEQLTWLRGLFSELPKNIPKTVMMHVPLFIDNADETDSEAPGKAIPNPNRKILLDLFCENNVNLIFSGHTHMTNEPNGYNCGNYELKQIILTSINAQLDWQSDSKYYPKGKPQFIKVNYTLIEHNVLI